ncbi:hypothetical protein Q3G72_002090 [Acer saccharum]|nr:hypothetical protein Q3G72_002090 [Acer saccharum]
MHASLKSCRIAAVNILCLYYAIWSSGSVVPSYCFMFEKLNFLGIFVRAIASTNGESTELLAVLFFIRAGTHGILWMRASISVNLQENSKLADKCKLDLGFTNPGVDWSDVGVLMMLSGATPSTKARNSSFIARIAAFSASSAYNFLTFAVIWAVNAAICSSTVRIDPPLDMLIGRLSDLIRFEFKNSCNGPHGGRQTVSGRTTWYVKRVELY